MIESQKFVVTVKNLDGESLELLKTYDESFARGAREGVMNLLKFLESDMDFEEGFVCEIKKEQGYAPSSFRPEMEG